jgi:VWFA-related protein
MSSALMACGLEGMRGRIRADATYGMLEGIVRLLGQVREDRANILFVSTGLSRAGRTQIRQTQPMLPNPTGLVNGRIQTLRGANDMNERFCRSEAQRLADTDFSRRFDELTRQARAANVAFYPVPVTFFQPILYPVGMGASGGFTSGPRTMPGRRTMLSPSDSLLPLAKDTGGFYTSKPGDVTEGLRRIAADNGSHYLLGYSSTNAKRDGKMRSITVRLKKTGDEIRARRQYRAPSMDDIQDLLRPTGPTRRVVPEAIVTALEPLKGVQPSTQFFTYAAVTGSTLQVTIEVPALAVQAGRWADGAALDLIADAADGKTVGIGRGRLPGNGRTTVTVPLEGPTPPSVLMVRLRAEGESITQRVPIIPNPSSLVRDPQVFRSSHRGLNTPVASFMFARDERVKVDWPVTKRLDSHEARLLDRFGLPLKFRVPLQEQEVGQGTHLVTELALAPLGRGDYIIELTATAGSLTETRLLALRVR